MFAKKREFGFTQVRLWVSFGSSCQSVMPTRSNQNPARPKPCEVTHTQPYCHAEYDGVGGRGMSRCASMVQADSESYTRWVTVVPSPTQSSAPSYERTCYHHTR